MRHWNALQSVLHRQILSGTLKIRNWVAKLNLFSGQGQQVKIFFSVDDENVKIFRDGVSLINVTSDQAGVYTCYAVQNLGKFRNIQSRETRLIVKCKIMSRWFSRSLLLNWNLNYRWTNFWRWLWNSNSLRFHRKNCHIRVWCWIRASVIHSMASQRLWNLWKRASFKPCFKVESECENSHCINFNLFHCQTFNRLNWNRQTCWRIILAWHATRLDRKLNRLSWRKPLKQHLLDLKIMLSACLQFYFHVLFYECFE